MKQNRRDVLNFKGFQSLVEASRVLMRTADFQMIGQQLDFAFLSNLVKKKEEIVLNEFAEEEKMMQ